MPSAAPQRKLSTFRSPATGPCTEHLAGLRTFGPREPPVGTGGPWMPRAQVGLIGRRLRGPCATPIPAAPPLTGGKVLYLAESVGPG